MENNYALHALWAANLLPFVEGKGKSGNRGQSRSAPPLEWLPSGANLRFLDDRRYHLDGDYLDISPGDKAITIVVSMVGKQDQKKGGIPFFGLSISFLLYNFL